MVKSIQHLNPLYSTEQHHYKTYTNDISHGGFYSKQLL